MPRSPHLRVIALGIAIGALSVACGGSGYGSTTRSSSSSVSNASASATAAVPPSGGGGSASGGFTVVGSVKFTGVQSCVLDSANDVVIADQNKTVLAAAVMSPIQGSGGDCFETFTIRNVPDRPLYQFLESGIVVATISKADLAAKNFDMGAIVSD